VVLHGLGLDGSCDGLRSYRYRCCSLAGHVSSLLESSSEGLAVRWDSYNHMLSYGRVLRPIPSILRALPRSRMSAHSINEVD